MKLILSIDGGGMRGLLPLVILDYVEREIREGVPEFLLSQRITHYAGCSTGSLICASMFHKRSERLRFSLGEIISLYLEKGAEIFSPDQEGNPGLHGVIDANFANHRVGRASSPFVFPVYELSTATSMVATEKGVGDLHSDVELSTVLKACTALPEYFPPVAINGYRMVDGMLFAKNPAGLAVERFSPGEGDVLISMGTGDLVDEAFDHIEEEVLKVDERCREESARRGFEYLRIQPELFKADSHLANVDNENLFHLIEDAHRYIEHHYDKIRRLLEIFRQAPTST